MKLLLLVCACFISYFSFAQFPSPYCSENFSSGIRPITRVTFNTINNISSATATLPAHEDFTTVTTNVVAGTTYALTVQGNTAGNWSDYYRAWFDWNGNGVLGDANELYEVGSITNSTGTDAKTATINITIPFGGVAGPIRMRISKRFSAAPSLCNTVGNGQAEDYTVYVSFPPPKPIYVNALATGLNNGTSWTNAFTSLNAALQAANPKDTVKVAAGTYKPGTINTSTFSLKEGMVLMGGYPATGNPADADRSAGTQQTIISGDINTNPIYHTNHLFTLQQLTDSTIVDGLIIEDGYAPYNDNQALMRGAGMMMTNTSLTVRNCVFRRHYAFSSGASLAITGGSPRFLNCFFLSNTGDSSVVWATGNSTPVFTNCVFAKNKSAVILLSGSNASVKNCNFVNNMMKSIPQRSYCIVGLGTSTVQVTNSIFYNNGTNYSSDSIEIKLESGSPLVVNTIMQVAVVTTPGLQSANPKFRDTANIAGPDGFYFTADDGLQLVNPCSPAINSGDAAFVSGITKDMLGQPRIANGAVDLGPYEMQSAFQPIPSTVYVNWLSQGANDGSSWANAYTDLGKALASCSDTIKVAAGMYYPSATDPMQSFWLENKRIILGGYPSYGNPTNSQRNPATYLSIVSGNLPNSGGIHSQVLFRGRVLDSTSKIDGLVMEDVFQGDYPNEAKDYASAIYLSVSASPEIRNCTFRKNTGNPGGALITKQGSNPLVYQCTFDGNLASGVNLIPSGGAVANHNSAPRFIKCSFTNNTGKYNTYMLGNGGAAIFNNYSNAIIDSCTFSTNKHGSQGGAICNYYSNPVIKNSVFNANQADYLQSSSAMGGDISNMFATAQISKCTFNGGATSANGGFVANRNQSTATFDSCTFRSGRAVYDGATIYNNASTSTFRKCVFTKNEGPVFNTSNAQASFTQCIFAMNERVIYNTGSQVSFLNCTMSNNDDGGDTWTITNRDGGILYMRNCVMADVPIGPNAIDIIDTGFVKGISYIYNSITFNKTLNGVSGNIAGKPVRLVNNLDPDGPDNIFFTADDGIALSSCSPAINAGDNSFATGLTTDVLNNPRQNGSAVDMGAYEFQGQPQTIRTVYVNQAATGANTGVDWANAYTDFRRGICEPCGDTVKVAAGLYKPAVTGMDSSFEVKQPLTIWGGYPSTGNPGDNLRDPLANPTILSGDVGVSNNMLDNSINLVYCWGIRDTIEFDGFTIREAGGSSNLGIATNSFSGGGITTGFNHTIIRHCNFINNAGFPGGGGVSIGQDGTAIVSECLFEGNQHRALTHSGKSLKLKNCAFVDNSATDRGGAVSIGSANFEMGNCLFYKNRVTVNSSYGQGGAVHSTGLGTIYNCTFVENSVAYSANYMGGGLYTNNSTGIPVRNCIFYNNRTAGSTSITGADFDWQGNYSTTKNCLLQITRLDPSNKYAQDPKIADLSNPAGPDGRWMTVDDGLRVKYNSPGVNYGQTSYVANDPLDLGNSPRVIGTVVDAGAYEYQAKAEAFAGKDTTICAGTSVTIGSDMNPAFTYSWSSSPAGYSATTPTAVVNPAVTTTYYLTVTNGAEVAQDTVVITVSSALTPAVTITTPTLSVCQGSGVSFNATSSFGSASPSYQWKINGNNVGTNSTTFITSALVNGDQVSLVMTSYAACVSPASVTSNVLSMTVNALVTPSVSIVQSPSPGCDGSPVQFIATGVNAGASPTWYWVSGSYMIPAIVNGNNTLTVPAPPASLSGAQFWVRMTTSACPVSNATVSSNVLSISVAPKATVSVSISASVNQICAGTPVTFTATPVNGGTAPTYQWKKNGMNVGTNAATYTDNSIAHGDVVSVDLMSSMNCVVQPLASSNVITMFVQSSAAPVVTISSTSSTICPGSSVTFSATATNAVNAVYQWKKNGVNVGSNSSSYTNSTWANGDVITLSLSNNAGCNTSTVTSNAITINMISEQPTTVSIATGNATICQGSNVTFTATANNVVSGSIYQWKKNGVNVGTNSATYSNAALANGDVITLSYTTTLPCSGITTVNSNTVTMAVNPVLVSSVSISGITSLTQGSSVTISSAIQNGGAAPTYQWQDSTALHSWQNITGATNASISYMPVSTGNKLRCIMTSNAICATPANVTSNALSFILFPTALSPVNANVYGIMNYPNPVEKEIYIGPLRNEDHWISVDVVSMDGKQKLLSKRVDGVKTVMLNVQKLAAGMYTIVVKNRNGGSAYMQFVKL